MGGKKDIVNNQNVLDDYVLTGSEMANIVEEFCEVFDAHGEEPMITNVGYVKNIYLQPLLVGWIPM